MPHVVTEALATAAAAISSVIDRVLARPSSVPLIVTAAAIATLHLTRSDAALNDRFAARFAVAHEDAPSPALAIRGPLVAQLQTASEALESIW